VESIAKTLLKQEKRNSPIDMHTYIGSASDNHVTLIVDLRFNARWAIAMRCMLTKFGIDSSSRFSLRARAHRQTRSKSQTLLIMLPNASATVGVCNKITYSTMINIVLNVINWSSCCSKVKRSVTKMGFDVPTREFCLVSPSTSASWTSTRHSVTITRIYLLN